MLKKLLIGVAVLVVGFLVVVALQPSEYHIERTQEIDAPPEVVWAEIASFAQWKQWNPWELADPTQKNTITGEPGAVGHKTVWEGDETGKGQMTITQADSPTRLVLDLVFKEPMESAAETAFVLEPKGNTVAVTWSMDGKNGFVGKVFSLIMDMDTMIGSAYEEGLANIKRIAEENAEKQAVAAAEPADNESGELVED